MTIRQSVMHWDDCSRRWPSRRSCSDRSMNICTQASRVRPIALSWTCGCPALRVSTFRHSLSARATEPLFVFITAHADIPMSVRAMKAGAMEYLTKPFRHQELLDAVRSEGENHRLRRAEALALADLQARFASLTPRERQIMGLLAEGRITKQIAGEIGISAMTLRIHRNQVISKMGARSTADLVRMADS